MNQNVLNQTFSVTLLGARGSVPVNGEDYQRYGRGTTCVLVRLAGQTVVLDGGTGMLELDRFLTPSETNRPLTLLLSHTHVDHIMGLLLCPLIFRKEVRLDVFCKTRAGQAGQEQVERLMSPPLWPVGPDLLPADIRFHELTHSFSLGAVQVTSAEGVHPGGVSLLRLTGGGKSVVLMTDCTLEVPGRDRFLDFARSCDLLLCDGQYSPEEWETRSGFGHSTWEQAARFGRDCGARLTCIIHHDPFHTDDCLDEAEKQVRIKYPQCVFGRAGEEWKL